jgi:ATP synthase protein I
VNSEPGRDRRGDGIHRPPTVEGAQFLGAGIQFAASILVFLFLGRWLDDRLGTEPWLLLLGVMVGASAGFYSLYRQLVIAPRKKQPETRERR